MAQKSNLSYYCPASIYLTYYFIIEHGKIIEDGSHQEPIALVDHYAELFNLQAEAYR